MPWTIEWSMTQEAKAHKADGNPRVFEAKTQDEALHFAEEQINNGRIVWCLKDEGGALVMDRPAVFDLVHSARRPSKLNPPKAPEPPPERKPSPFEHVMRFFRKQR